MSWLAENWLWVVLGGGFIGLHLFGHRMGSGCGGHAHGSHSNEKSDGPARPRTHGKDM
jgi:hypothetical protein